MAIGDSFTSNAYGNYQITTGSTPVFTGTSDQTWWNGNVTATCNHEVEKWAEYLDGECVGVCKHCDQRIAATRMPGGLPFMRLKALAELLIATPDDSALYLEINEISDLVEREQEALDEARALLATAKKMAGCEGS